MSRGAGGGAFPEGRGNRTRGRNSKVLTKQITWCETGLFMDWWFIGSVV